MRISVIITAVLFAIFSLIMVVWTISQDSEFAAARAQLQISFLTRAFGLFITAAAGLALLLTALAGGPALRLGGLVLAALAGALLIEPSWGVAMALALAAIAVAARPWLFGRRAPATPDVSPAL